MSASAHAFATFTPYTPSPSAPCSHISTAYLPIAIRIALNIRKELHGLFPKRLLLIVAMIAPESTKHLHSRRSQALRQRHPFPIRLSRHHWILSPNKDSPPLLSQLTSYAVFYHNVISNGIFVDAVEDTDQCDRNC